MAVRAPASNTQAEPDRSPPSGTLSAMNSRIVRGLWLLTVGGALLSPLTAACSSSGSTPTTEAVTAESVLDTAADAMAGVDTVSFHLVRMGAPVYLDSGRSFAFEEGEGRVSNTASSADALVKVKALGIDTQVGAVSIDGELWLSNPLTGAWAPAPDSITFDPVTLFNPETGWTALLRDDLTGAQLIDDAENGQWHVNGQAAGTRLAAITGGLVHNDAPIDVWIDQASGHVVTAEFTTAGTGTTGNAGTRGTTGTDTTGTTGTTGTDGETSWHMDLSDFGVEVAITRPAAAGGN
jgi:LppX_LprAFG lipoprotein